MSRRDLTMSERCERIFNPNWKDPRDAEESAGAPKGSVAHQIEMAVVRETLRKAVIPPEISQSDEARTQERPPLPEERRPQ